MVSSEQQKKRVAVKSGIYKVATAPGEKDYLYGSRCKACGTYFYPQRGYCANCFSDDLEEVALSERGKVWSYTVVTQTYPGAVLTGPFVMAAVELPEKVWVDTLLTDVDIENVQIDTEVEIYFFKVSEDEEKEVIAFAFRPVSS